MQSSFPHGRISCSEGVQCFLTSNQRDFVTSDAVFIHSKASTKLPPASLRPPGQLWVFYTRESPPYAGTFYKEKNIFNLTMTYLRKSDIVESYGKVLPGRFGGGFNSSRNYLEGKNRSAVAVISNCKQKGRLEYVHELSKFIDVDVYGRCGKQILCKNCWEDLQRYKFYLSFENSICIDYVTEKFYDNGLKFGMVPVVLGGANYSDPSVAPPGSYINARDFVSVQKLAKFLAKVGSEPQLYNQYFQWRSHYKLARNHRDMCDLCVLLHQNRTIKVYEDVMQWYIRENHCEPYPDVTHT